MTITDAAPTASGKTPIGWEGRTLASMLEESDRLFTESGAYAGLSGNLALKETDPIGYEKLFARLRGGLVSARETALNISASPIVRELGELCFALYTPEGDSIALSTGIIVHVHTMSDAIKYMVRSGYEENPGIAPGDIFANNDPVIGDVHNADVQTFVPIFDHSDPERPELYGELVVAVTAGHLLDEIVLAHDIVAAEAGHAHRDALFVPCVDVEADRCEQLGQLRRRERHAEHLLHA